MSRPSSTPMRLAGLMGACTLAAGIASAPHAAPAQAPATWTKTYVVEWHDLAFLYGGPPGGNGDTPGSDCPGGANPANDWKTVLKTPWRSQAQVDEILSPDFNHQEMYRQFAIRGPNRENIMDNPTLEKDPGMILVTGKVAEGFDLDDNPRTGGFVSPEGHQGVDNQFYRVAGCIAGLRGPPRTAMWQKQQNDGMHDGIFTIVLVLSGAQDSRNDDDATLGIYVARDPMVKDANGGMARDYSYRIDPDPKYQSVVKVRIKDGVIESQAPSELHMRDFSNHTAPFELVLYKAKMRFEEKPDGSLSGMIGGYRNWLEFYHTQNGNGKNGGVLGSIRENLWHMSMPAFYYALQRNADAMPDPKTGRNTAISAAYRIDAIPAFVIAPDTGKPAQVARAY